MLQDASAMPKKYDLKVYKVFYFSIFLQFQAFNRFINHKYLSVEYELFKF